MIYILQPFGYKTQLVDIVQTYLSQQYPSEAITIKQHYPFNHPTTAINIYFIINDPSLKTWNGLHLSHTIRLKEPKAILILASTEIDYLTLFRSHIAFFGILDLNQLTKTEITSYLDDSLQLSS